MQTSNTTQLLGSEVQIVNPTEPNYIDDSVSPELEHFIKTKLADRFWRLNNLYTIVDKEDNKIILNLNAAQVQVHKAKHPKVIVLKSRQQGISTYKVAEGLDKCMYNSNTQAGIQSYGQSEAKKLYKKALLMWSEYDQDVVGLLGIELISANAEGLTFSNGSTLKIGNFRGDSLSYLHVSELAKIAKKFPEKAEELNTGAFEAVSTNSSISIESTAEGNTGLFFDIWKTAELRLKVVGCINSLTPLDFQPIFLSWLDDDDCNMDEYYPPEKADIKYFNKVETELGITLTETQKSWASAKRARLKDKFDREYPYSPDSAFNIKVEGTYYSNEFEQLVIKEENYDENLKVHSAMDLGMNDMFSIGFFQYHRGKAIIIGEYSNRGQGLEHYRDVYSALAKDLGWVHGITYVPHDIAVKELTSGMTRWDKMGELGFETVLVDKHKVIDGIEVTRTFLIEYLDSINSSCIVVLKAIQNYRQKFDEKYQVFLDAPLHDEHSHPADMVRYMAMGLKLSPPTDNLIHIKPVKKVYKGRGYDV